jgi:hypothetical protein
MQHNPRVSLVVGRDLAEVVTTTHCPQGFAGILGFDLRVLAPDRIVAARERTPRPCRPRAALAGEQAGPLSDHSAADVDANSGRHDRTLRGNNRTDGRADTEVNVWHGRDVRVNERQRCDVFELSTSDFVAFDAVDPRLDRKA